MADHPSDSTPLSKEASDKQNRVTPGNLDESRHQNQLRNAKTDFSLLRATGANQVARINYPAGAESEPENP
jgi:hypothetical protein